jgi:hypothetical protein
VAAHGQAFRCAPEPQAKEISAIQIEHLRKIIMMKRWIVGLVLCISVVSFSGVHSLNQQSFSILDQGLMAYWSFDEGEGDIAFDETNNGNDAVLYGPTWVEGKRGFALRFDGVDDTVAIPHSASLMPTDAITLAAWVKIEGPAQEHYGIIGKSGYSSGYRLLIHGTNKKVLFQLTGEKGYSVWSSTAIPDDQWHFIVATYDGSKMKLYIDGIKDPSEKERKGPLDVNTNSVLIGKPQYAFNGLIDEVRIYSRALSEEEIKELFQMGQVQ